LGEERAPSVFHVATLASARTDHRMAAVRYQAQLLIVSDVTELRRQAEELQIKVTMIREIHHRVKNNLQTIASLLRMQARRSDSDYVRQALAEGVSRILSVAVIHESWPTKTIG